MRIIYLILIVCLGIATAKYLPNESASLINLHRHLRSIEDDSAVTNEDKSDNADDSDDDTSEEGTIPEQLQKIEEERQEILRKQAKLKLKQEEEQLKQQEKNEKEERKRQEKIEKEERKHQEKQQKEERKHQEKIEKEKRKQEEADRKHQEKIEKEERKRLEKIQKQLEQLEKDTLESNKIPSDSSESLETNESHESLDLEDIWRNHIYAKYGLSVNSTDLEKKAVLNKYSEEELGLNVNSTKSERRLAVNKLIQNNLNKNDTSQDALRHYILSHINVVAIQQLRVKLEDNIAKLNNESVLLKNSTMPWVPEAKQTIDEKRTLIQSVLQFLSHLLPNWVTGGQATSNINSNTAADSQGNTQSSLAVPAAPNVNEVSSNTPGAASSGVLNPGQGPTIGSIENEDSTASIASNTIPSLPSASLPSSTDAAQTGGASSGAESSTASTDISFTNVGDGGNTATSLGGNTSSGSAALGASNSTANTIDSTAIGGSLPTENSPTSRPSGSGTDESTAQPINDSTGFPVSNDNSALTEPAEIGSTTGQESVSSANSPISAGVLPSEVIATPGTADGLVTESAAPGVEISGQIDASSIVSISTNGNPGDSSIVTSVQNSVTGPNSSAQESSVPSGETVSETGTVDVTASNVDAPGASSVDSSWNGVATSDSVTVNRPNNSTQESPAPSSKPVSATEPVNMSESNAPATNSIDSSLNEVSTSSASAAVNKPNSSTQESQVPSSESVTATVPVDAAESNVDALAISSIDSSVDGVLTSSDGAAVSRPIDLETPSAQESTTGINGPLEPVDVSSTGMIAPGKPTIDPVSISSISANSPETESVNVISTAPQESTVTSTDTVPISYPGSVSGSSDGTSIILQEPAIVTTDNSVASVSTVATENIDVVSAGVEQVITVDTTQVNSEPNVIESSLNSIGGNSATVSDAGPIVASTEVPAKNITNDVNTTDTSSLGVLPNTSSSNTEEITGSVVVTESLTNEPEAASVITNVSNLPDSTFTVVDVSTNSNIATSSVSGVSEPTKVEDAPTNLPDVIATDVTVSPEIVTVDNSVTPEQISVEKTAPTTNLVSNIASLAPEVNKVLKSVLSNEPGASVIEITPQ